jgi:chromosome segregation ATPase
MSDECAWLEARLAKTEEMIEKLEDAILTLSSGAQSYELDDGQTRVRKTMADIEQLRLMLRELEGRRENIQTRLCGLGVTHGTPNF